jgi:hypothetical protein
MSYLRFGIHAAGVGGVYDGFGDYIMAMQHGNKPAIVFAVDNAGPAFAVQALGRPFDVVGFRMTQRDGVSLDQLDYGADPVAFGQWRFEKTLEHWPPELDAARVWTTPCNEPSKERFSELAKLVSSSRAGVLSSGQAQEVRQLQEQINSDTQWLAAFTLEYARLSIAAGRRFAAYGWSMGTPEAWFWELPDTLAYLRLCAQHPHLLGINLHEYSGSDNLRDDYPWLIGRFAALHDICQRHGIARPTIIIGEFGWRENSLRPAPDSFADQLMWAQALYAPCSNILGAAIWTLGHWHGTVAQDFAALIPELSALALGYVGDPVPPPPPPPPPPSGQHRAIVVKIPQAVTQAEHAAITAAAYPYRHTVTQSHDDMMTILRGGNAESYVKAAFPGRDAGALAEVAAAGYRWETLPGFVDDERVIRNRIADLIPANPRYVRQVPITTIAVHHFASNSTIEQVHTYHNTQFGRGIAYHYVIGNDASIHHCIPHNHQGTHVANHNSYTLAVCFQGNLTTAGPSEAMLQAAEWLVARLRGQIPTITAVKGHKDFSGAATQCPGNSHPSWLSRLTGGTVPPPPPGTAVDLLPYLRGDGRLYEVRHPLGDQERFQTQVDGTIFWLVKNGQYETFASVDGFIWRGIDTSPGPAPTYAERPGELRYYRQFEPGQSYARWCKRSMVPGETYTGPVHQVQYHYKSDCSLSSANSGTAVNRVTFVRLHASRTWNGITVQDVAELTNDTETFYFARGLGLVAWVSPWGESAISELHAPGARPDNVRESGCWSS